MVRYFWFKYDLGQKYQAPQVRPERGSNSWPPDNDSTVYVTETLLKALGMCKIPQHVLNPELFIDQDSPKNTFI